MGNTSSDEAKQADQQTSGTSTLADRQGLRFWWMFAEPLAIMLISGVVLAAALSVASPPPPVSSSSESGDTGEPVTPLLAYVADWVAASGSRSETLLWFNGLLPVFVFAIYAGTLAFNTGASTSVGTVFDRKRNLVVQGTARITFDVTILVTVASSFVFLSLPSRDYIGALACASVAFATVFAGTTALICRESVTSRVREIANDLKSLAEILRKWNTAEDDVAPFVEGEKLSRRDLIRYYLVHVPWKLIASSTTLGIFVGIGVGIYLNIKYSVTLTQDAPLLEVVALTAGGVLVTYVCSWISLECLDNRSGNRLYPIAGGFSSFTGMFAVGVSGMFFLAAFSPNSEGLSMLGLAWFSSYISTILILCTARYLGGGKFIAPLEYRNLMIAQYRRRKRLEYFKKLSHKAV